MPKFELHYHKLPKIINEDITVIQNNETYEEYGIYNIQY